MQAEGYAAVYYTYDSNSNIIETRYTNAADKPVAVRGAARITSEYDDQHHMTYEATFDTEDQPVMLNEGYAARRMTYNEQTGLLSSITYLDGNDQPV